MAILKIARMGHPVLLRRADPVPDPTNPEMRRLVRDMIETMEDAGGAGLAAPQVHVPLRLFVFRIPPSRATGTPGDAPMGNTVLVNPEVEPLGEEQRLHWEGCLSIPGLRAAVPRWVRVRYRGGGRRGRPSRDRGPGLPCRRRAARAGSPGRDTLPHAHEGFSACSASRKSWLVPRRWPAPREPHHDRAQR